MDFLLLLSSHFLHFLPVSMPRQAFLEIWRPISHESTIGGFPGNHCHACLSIIVSLGSVFAPVAGALIAVLLVHFEQSTFLRSPDAFKRSVFTPPAGIEVH
jgi:hypothetical protein